MSRMMKNVLGVLCAVSLFATSAARADIPPPDTCNTKGAVCHNAGTSASEDGVCTAKTCSKGPPGQEYTYECLLCEPGTPTGAAGASGAAGESGNAGAAGEPVSHGAAGALEGGAGTSGSESGAGGVGATGGGQNGGHGTDDGGCSVGILGTERGVASLMLGLGLVAIGVSRRRRG